MDTTYARDDAMQLTKEEAIRRHRMMWEWIAEETLRQNRIIKKEEAFRHFGWRSVPFHCWCCEYAFFIRLRKTLRQGPFNGNKCIFCPIKWSRINHFCMNDLSPFRAWDRIVLKSEMCACDWYDIQDAAKYAKEIANLPEREMED